MLLLPKWILTGTLPAYMDAESKTAIEQTYKIYQKMNEIIEDYNKFVDETNKTITNHVNTCEQDHEVFATALRQEFKDFIDVVELKLMDIEQTMIQQAITDIDQYVRTEIPSKLEEMINEELTAIRTEIERIKNHYLTIDSFNGLMGEVQDQIDTLGIQKLDKTTASETYATKDDLTNANNMLMIEVNKKVDSDYVDEAIATAITETLGGNY